MIRALWTASISMNSQQLEIDNISNNLANVNTRGYKETRSNFKDLIYQDIVKSSSSNGIGRPMAVQVGNGMGISSTQKLFSQGSLKKSESNLDIAVMGEGFIRVKLPNGDFGYKRDGSMTIDSKGNLVDPNGYFIENKIQFKNNFLRNSISIDKSGKVTYATADMKEGDPKEIAGVIKLYRFIAPEGLSNIGDNLFIETPASGKVYKGNAATEGYGSFMQGFSEQSNVNMSDQLVNLIVAQRAYEFCSKAIQTSDSMLSIAVNLKKI